MKNRINRRTVLKTVPFAFMGIALPHLGFTHPLKRSNQIPNSFPNIAPEIIAEVVGKSHANLDRVKELVNQRPELSRAVWEWRFGDFESAIGAASHVGRRDIALYLIEKGARPTLFTFAMLGAYSVVKSSIEAVPGIQKCTGPHGISLLAHAYAGERMKDKMTKKEVNSLQKTIHYLESLGDAGGEQYIDVSPEAQKKYLGDYKYGKGEKDGFTVNINMRKLLSLAPLGGFGGALYKIGENRFIYNGAPSVEVSFEIKDGKVLSLTLTEPDVKVVAKKV